MTTTPPPAPDPRLDPIGPTQQQNLDALKERMPELIKHVLDQTPAPDTRPRASLELTAADLARLHTGDVVVGYTVTDMGGSRERFTVALAQPAPTPSGDAARGKRHQRAVTASVANAYLDEMERLAAALQVAREGWKRALYHMARLITRAEAAEAEVVALRAGIKRLGAARYDNQMDVVYVTLDDGTYLSAALYAAAPYGAEDEPHLPAALDRGEA